MKLSDIPNIKQNEPLKKHSQIKIGGPAEYYLEVQNKENLVSAISIAHSENIHVNILGWGSNTLISSRGVQGLVIVNKSNKIRILDTHRRSRSIEEAENDEQIMSRLDQLQPKIYGDFSELNYAETNLQTSRVYMDSGVSLPLAIFKTIKADLTGLQWYAGIPGTIGGAVINNIHGGTHYITEVIDSIDVLDKVSYKVKNLLTHDINPNYDYTNLQDTKSYVLGATFNLYHGNSTKALDVMYKWRRQKRIQPQKSLGCMWHNISNQEKIDHSLESTSMGYIIDKELNLSGYSVGDAYISNNHASFIENKGNATSEEVLSVMSHIYNQVYEKYGIQPKAEIFFLGFDEKEISKFK